MSDQLSAARKKRESQERLVTLRETLGDAIAQKKAHDVPDLCVKLGLIDRATDAHRADAFRSKRGFVRPMLANKAEPDLLTLAEAVLGELDHPELENLLSELTKHSAHRVSKLVRKDVLGAMNKVERIFGDRPVIETLEELFGSNAVFQERLSGLLGSRARGPITQHYILNLDWSHEEMLAHCGALDCPQTTFFRLIETVLDPMTRRDLEQSDLALAISACLRRDGFAVASTATQSGYPVYEVVRPSVGVDGAMKNLIFASVGPKPEIVITDALNNDVQIVKHADKVLVFDKALSSSQSLTWGDLRSWWAEKTNIADPNLAKAGLYERLRLSVKLTKSPGELILFDTYYRHFGPLLQDKLPALIPQVYLHYDPYTIRQRDGDSVLVRQRMDFLMLLGNTVRVVLEVDGQHHYGSDDGTGHYSASAAKYAVMAAEDRLLRLAGYEVYRFGAAELRLGDAKSAGDPSRKIVVDFFEQLLRRHGK